MAEKKQKQDSAQTPEPAQNAELVQEPVEPEEPAIDTTDPNFAKNFKGFIRGNPLQAEDPDVQESEPEQVQPATDKAIPGGLYIVNDQVVDANGKALAGYSVVNGQVVKDK